MTEHRIVVASNRGPVTFVEKDGELVARRGSGGLVTALTAVVQETGGLWVAAAMSDGDRARARAAPDGRVDVADGDAKYRLGLLEFDPRTYDRAYNAISNRLLWFLHHYLWDLPRAPVWTRETWEAWDAFRSLNRDFASAIADEAHGDETFVLVQDYHLSLVPGMLRAQTPSARVAHFHHSPFVSSAYARLLPPKVLAELLEGLLGADVLGFQTGRWADAFLSCCEVLEDAEVVHDRREVVWRGRAVKVREYPIGIDAPALQTAAFEPAVERKRTALHDRLGDRRLVLRVDRVEPAKNVLRGFLAFADLLRHRPEWRRRVVFLALLNPSRQDVPEYRAYTRECLDAAERINDELGENGWTPIETRIDDDFPEVLAAYRLYDVLLVNTLFDGMNLVAKEGPALNENDGVLLLSRNAGAFGELGADATPVDPLDVAGTADAIHDALSLDHGTRATRARALRAAATGTTPAGWVGRQLEDLAEP